MIPAYECADTLPRTLRSVLQQSPDIGEMQIAVIDDYSRQDLSKVVASVGQGRVEYCRNAANLGAIATFNVCVERARGHLVHVLHADDWVVPGFYQSLTLTAERHPKSGLYCCQSQIVDEREAVIDVTPFLVGLASPAHDAAGIAIENVLRTPAVVVRRTTYEQIGGFRPELIHTADWEMWARAITTQGGVMIPGALACYSETSTNHTARLIRSAGNLEDCLRCADHLARVIPTFDHASFRANLARRALDQHVFFRKRGDLEASRANLVLWQRLATARAKVRRYLHAAVNRFVPP